MPSRSVRKASKKTKIKARAQASKSARKKSKPASKRSGTSARSSSRSKVKSRKPAPKHRVKRAVATKRPATSAPRKRQRESETMDTLYHMTVEEIEMIPSPENNLQTDLWKPEVPKS